MTTQTATPVLTFPLDPSVSVEDRLRTKDRMADEHRARHPEYAGGVGVDTIDGETVPHQGCGEDGD